MNSDLASDVIGLALLLVATVVAWRTVRAATAAARRALSDHRPEDVLTLLAAVIATVVQGTGMWRFFGVTLHLDGPLRVLLFAFIEIALFVEALRARRNVIETGSAGVDGLAVWALAGLSAVLSALDARSFAEALFRLSVPPVTAWLWERLMAVERRRATGRRIHWRITPERILVRLGLAEGDERTASDVDAHRRLTRVAVATQRLSAAPAGSRRERFAGRRQAAAVRRAVEYADLATNPDRQAALLAQLGALSNAQALAEVRPPAPWGVPADRPKLRIVSKQELEGIAAGRERTRVPDDVLPPIPRDLEPLVKKGRRKFRREIEAGQAPSIARLKETLRIGQDRAQAIKPYLAVPEGQCEA